MTQSKTVGLESGQPRANEVQLGVRIKVCLYRDYEVVQHLSALRERGNVSPPAALVPRLQGVIHIIRLPAYSFIVL